MLKSNRLHQVGDLVGTRDGYKEGVIIRDQLTKEFAALNGWRESTKCFGLQALAKSKYSSYWEQFPLGREGQRLCDHPLRFKLPRGPSVAYVIQPYDHITVDDFEGFTDLNLVTQFPPNPLARPC